MPRDDYEDYDGDLPEEDEPEEEDIAVEDEDDWEDEVDTDDDVADIFDEAQNLDFGRGDLTRKLRSYTDKNPTLSGGDIDADWASADVGEETVGGQNPTPDQSDVDEIGEAMGVVYEDDEPLDTDDKLEERDKEPWELNPASARPEFGARAQEELAQPLHSVASNVQRKRTSPNASAEKSARAAVGGKTSTRAQHRTKNVESAERGRTGNRVPAEGRHSARNRRVRASVGSAPATTHRAAGTGRGKGVRARRRTNASREGGKRA